MKKYNGSSWGWSFEFNENSLFFPDEDAQPGMGGSILDYQFTEDDLSKIRSLLN